MAGIDSLVNARADMFAANPQGLQQRYAMNQDLLDLLALQKLKKDKEAAQRSLQMQMQPTQGTVKDQLAGQVMDMTKQEVAASLAPGIQQQGQRMAAQQVQRAMSGGLPTLPAPNMVGMARGGIVGYAPGGDVQFENDFIQTFTTPTGETLTRDDLVMMRNAGQIPQEMMLTDSSGQRLTVSDAIINPMSRSSEIDETPEGVARRAAYNRIGAERNRPLEESPEDYLFRTMTGMDNTRGFDAREEIGGEQPVGEISRSAYDVRQRERTAKAPTGARMREGLEGIAEYLGRIPDAARWLMQPETLRGEMNLARNVFGATPLGQIVGRGVDALSATTTENMAPAVEPQLPALPPSPAVSRSGIAAALPTDRRSAEEAAMDTYNARASAQRTETKPPAEPRRSRYEAELDRLDAEEKDKLGGLIDFLLAAGASGGTNLGATLMGGGSGLQARERRIGAERAAAVKGLEDLMAEQARLAQQESQFTRGLESEEEQARLDREQRAEEAQLEAIVRAAAAEKGITPAQLAELRQDIVASQEAQDAFAQIEESVDPGGIFSRRDPAVVQAEIDARKRAWLLNKERQLLAAPAGGATGFTYLGAE